MLLGPPARCWLALVFAVARPLAALAEDVTIQSTAPEIVYSPPACNAMAPACQSAWQVVSSPDDPSAVITSTSGPTNGSAALVPQLFLTFTGTTLYIRTSSASTALVNVSLATQDPDFAITARVDTAAAGGLITVVGLPSDRATTLSMTYVASQAETRLDVSNITIVTTSNDPFSSSPLPSSTTIPTFSPVISPATSAPVSHKQTRDDVIAEVLGSILGVVLCLSAAAAFVFWRKQRKQGRATSRTPGD